MSEDRLTVSVSTQDSLDRNGQHFTTRSKEPSPKQPLVYIVRMTVVSVLLLGLKPDLDDLKTHDACVQAPSDCARAQPVTE